MVDHGVQQGSVLGPLMFIIYVNDLPAHIHKPGIHPRLFADDLAILSAHHDCNVLKSLVDDSAIQVLSWTKDNYLVINKSKTQTLHFSLALEEHNYVQFLGVLLDNRLNWDAHINGLLSRLSTGIYLLRKIRQCVSKQILINVYYAYFYCHLNYGVLLWGNSSSSKRVFVLQKRALRVMFGMKWRQSCRLTFVENGLLTLPALYVYRCILHIRTNLSQQKLGSDVHDHVTRNVSMLRWQRARLTKSQNFVDILGIKLYNNVPNDLKALTDNTFKFKVKELLIKKCLYRVDDFL